MKLKSVLDHLISVISYIWVIVILFILWDLYVKYQGFNSIVLPSPWAVFRSIIFDFELYALSTWKTLWVSIVGLLIGSLLGATIAVVGWISAIASGLVSINAIVVRSVPIVVFVPILATIMGYNTTMVLTLVALMSFFPSFVMVSSGLSSLPRVAHDVSSVYGATKLRKLYYIALPASLPNFLSSIRLSASRAILATMVAEFLTGIDGLGRMFVLARADLQSEIALGAALVAAAASLAIYYLANNLEVAVTRRLF